MKKVVLILVMAAVLMLSSCGAVPSVVSPSPSASVSASPSPSALPSPSLSPSPAVLTVGDYYPFTPNLIMTYAGEGNEFAFFVSHVDYISNGAIQIRTNNGGTESVSVYTIDNGALKEVFSQPETYYMVDYTSLSTMSEIAIMEPIAVGTTWTLDSGDQRSITAIDASVTVPLGTYEALEVTTTYDDSTVKDYYAVDVGLIKRLFTPNSDPSNQISSMLQAYEVGNPLTQNARFYYPDFDNDQVAYVEKVLEFFTGDSLESKFETEFRNAPAGSSLAPLMSPATTINSITFDMNTGVATIDFSEEFITQMNAGTSLESMILTSVGDALGTYFQTDKVSITIDGGPYESGHILMNIGEYLTFDRESAVEYNP